MSILKDSNDQIGSPQTEYQEEQQPVECAHSPEGSNAGRNIRRTRSRWIPTLDTRPAKRSRCESRAELSSFGYAKARIGRLRSPSLVTADDISPSQVVTSESSADHDESHDDTLSSDTQLSESTQEYEDFPVLSISHNSTITDTDLTSRDSDSFINHHERNNHNEISIETQDYFLSNESPSLSSEGTQLSIDDLSIANPINNQQEQIQNQYENNHHHNEDTISFYDCDTIPTEDYNITTNDDIAIVDSSIDSSLSIPVIDLDSEEEREDNDLDEIDVVSRTVFSNEHHLDYDDEEVLLIMDSQDNQDFIEDNNNDDELQYVGEAEVQIPQPFHIQQFPTLRFIRPSLQYRPVEIHNQRLPVEIHDQRLPVGIPVEITLASIYPPPMIHPSIQTPLGSPLPPVDSNTEDPAVIVDTLMSKMFCPICYRSFRRTRQMIKYHQELIIPNMETLDIKEIEHHCASLESEIEKLKQMIEDKKNSKGMKKKGGISKTKKMKMKTRLDLAEDVRKENQKSIEENNECENVDDHNETSELRVAKCGHVYCQQCIEIHIKQKRTCPVCNQTIHMKHLYPLFL